ncbi:hypothetical protein AAG906_014542 [Vitis piasezkii]
MVCVLLFFIDTEDIGQTLTFAFEVSTGSTILCWCSHLLFLSCQFANCLKPFLTSTGLAIFSCMLTTLSSGVALTQAMPREFFTDFVKVAQDEGRHFTLLTDSRSWVHSMSIAAHDGLWDSATATTQGSVGTIGKGGLPRRDYHCAAGVKWFKYLCLRSRNPITDPCSLISLENEATERETTIVEEEKYVIQKFHATVRTHFIEASFQRGGKESCRVWPQWYEPLAVKEQPRMMKSNSVLIATSIFLLFF